MARRSRLREADAANALESAGYVDSNLLTAIATIIAAVVVYSVGTAADEFVMPLIAMTAGFFIYLAASDIIPDIHEQPRKIGTMQAGMLVLGIAFVGLAIYSLTQLGLTH